MLHRVLPPGPGLDLDSPGARQILLSWYAVEAPQSLRLNLVASLDGRAGGPDGTSGSLTSPTDRMVLGVIRETSDAVLVGARTVRAEGLTRPRRTPIVVLSASGDLSGHGFAETPTKTGDRRANILVVTTRSGAAVAHRTLEGTEHDVLIVGEHTGPLPLATVLQELRERGMHRIVAEGGPELASSLLAHGLVDELCLTLMPRILGAGIPVFDGVTSLRAHPRQVLMDQHGVQYGRWQLTPET
jgi:riboflavin biosynthesis pyrimidine reductase